MLAKPGLVLALASSPDATLPASSASDLVTAMRADMSNIIADFDETVGIYRLEETYDTVGAADRAWVLIGNLLGDWQPSRGSTVRDKAGLEIEHDARLLTIYNANILANDKVVRADGTFEYVVYVRRYAGHITAYLNRVKGSE